MVQVETVNAESELFSGLPPGVVEPARIKYKEEGRHYHTWDHILACMQAFSKERFQNPEPIRLAILFHDVIYDPKAKDNEEQSAEFAAVALGTVMGADPRLIQEVKDLILLTKDHWAPRPHLTNDQRLFLDIDIAVLGREWAVYSEYAESVRREYLEAGCKDWSFDFGRFRMLKNLCRRKRIFLSDAYHIRHGAQALSNVEREAAEIVEKQGFLFQLFDMIF